MGSRMVLAMVAAIAIVAVGGIGFATFTATATVNGTATGGTAELHWSGAPTYAYGSGYVTGCSPSFSGYDGTGDTVMTINAAGFAPGDYCQITETIVNGGTVGVTLSSSPGITGVTQAPGAPYGICYGYEWGLTDTVSGQSLAPGGSTSLTFTVSLSGSAGNECQGAVASFSDAITGTSYA